MMSLSGDARYDLQLVLKEEANDELSFQVASYQRATEGWNPHANGRVRRGRHVESDDSPGEPVSAIRARCSAPIPVKDNYELLVQQGLEYGPAFQGILELHQGEDEVIGRVQLPPSAEASSESYMLHPSLLDSCFQVLGVLLFAPDPDLPPGTRETYVASGIEKIVVHRRPPNRVFAHGRLRSRERKGSGKRSGDVVIQDESGEVFVEVYGLQAQRLEPVSSAPAEAEWLYERAWRKAAPLVAPVEPAQNLGRWLLLLDGHRTGVELAAALGASGQTCLRVVRGEKNERLEPDLYRIAPEQGGFEWLLEQEFAKRDGLRGVVHLWGLDTSWNADSDSPDLERDQETGVLTALSLSQALLRHGFRDVPRLFLVTRGVHALGDRHGANVSQAPLWGLGLVLSLEHPELSCKRIDLDPARPANESAALALELVSDEAEDQVGLSGEQRYVPRLVTAELPSEADAVEIRGDGSYLITGGLGGLGLTLGTRLAQRGAGQIVLMGRREPSSEARAAIAEMERAGAKVSVMQTDVSDAGQVAEAFQRMQDMSPLRGVVHAAVVLEDRTVLEQDAERFRKVLAPKLLGGWNLHRATAQSELDFFVLYSSAASLIGSPGQVNYVAANAALDALAYHRKSLGLPALAINWGAFSEVGSAAAQANRGERLAYRGVSSLTPEQGLRLFERLLRFERPQAGVIRLNVRQWLEFYPSAASAFWSEVLASQKADSANTSRDQAARDALTLASAADRPALLDRFLAEQLGRVLRIDASKLDRTDAFTAMGLDSLMSIELRNRLEGGLGLRLSATLLFTYPNLASLSEYLLGKLGRDTDAAPGATPVAAATLEPAEASRLGALPDDIQSLPEADLMRLFDDVLGQSQQLLARTAR
jgi:acyl transferase domain-containing protein/acyl carrier protein